ncbi:hypothetical protein BDV26DRAFT_305166 [Aspergillus bertholletiae]|uniref:Protein kinase domain-containing protein n=1 Tax=Aspergillus bertholletiae TaxID=1226010 RepID=A0A5N7B4I1_9EURO|nr:hypothetical protein BDV26DRAFT_305166 [Aspergillus bertholletiae]
MPRERAHVSCKAIAKVKPFQLSRPGELVRPIQVPENLRIEYFYLSDPVAKPGYPPMRFCSPERLHGKDPSFACGGVLTTITGVLGPLPEPRKGSYIFADGCDSWYDHNQTFNTKKTLALELARYRPDVDPAEQDLVLSIMQKVFVYSPEKRLTATQLLVDPSFKALMARYGC